MTLYEPGGVATVEVIQFRASQTADGGPATR